MNKERPGSEVSVGDFRNPGRAGGPVAGHACEGMKREAKVTA